MGATNFRVNNFDLIRLIAALGIALSHSIIHLKLAESGSFISAIPRFVAVLPGVPIFFFVSGFLISKSYENNPILKEYGRNRALRIYPALVFCTFLATMSLYFSGYLSSIDVGFDKILIWFMSQITFIQIYGPAFMNGFGAGTVNGVLWTITVELQFYLLIPVLYAVFGFAKNKTAKTIVNKENATLVLLIILFLVANRAYYQLRGDYGQFLIFKLFKTSFAPWLYMFLVGVFFQKNFEILHRFLRGKVLYALVAFLSVYYLSNHYLGWGGGNSIHPVLYLLLAPLVFSFAYSFPTLGTKALKGNDISYGVYIYHMPIVNLFIFYGLVANAYFLSMALALTLSIAAVSWLLIEKPSLKLKKRPLKPLKVADQPATANPQSSTLVR